MSAFVSFVNGLRGALNLIGNFYPKSQRSVPDAKIHAPNAQWQAICGFLLWILRMLTSDGPRSTIGSSWDKALEHERNPLMGVVTDLALEQQHLLHRSC